MKKLRNAGTLLLSATLSVTACSRPAEEPTRDAAVDARADGQQEQRVQEATRLEQQLEEVARDWQQVEAQLTAKKTAATAAVTAEIQEDVANAREAIAELRTTTAENWWERHEAVLEQTADEVEEDVRRFARRWSPPAPAEVGTSGEQGSWAARRDQLLARLEARIESMEQALEGVNARGAQQRELEDTRARVDKMKEDADRLRRASESDWWDITRDRVADYIERLDASIERVRGDAG